MTLDEYTADIFGQWITNVKSREAGHFLRHTHDGILVGVGTVLADNPSLTTRFADSSTRFSEPENARPIILDSQMRTPNDAQLRTVGKEPLWFCERDWVHPQPRGRCLGVDPDGDGLSLDQIASKLVREGIYSVLLEGGATIHRAFLEKGWVDRLEVFIAQIDWCRKSLVDVSFSSEVVGFIYFCSPL